jgi:hypothetical protein
MLAVETVQEADPCCVQVYLTRDRVTAFNTVNQYNGLTGFVNQVTCAKSFQLIVLMPSTLGTNNFNEIQGHSEGESKWNTILEKLEACLSCELALDFCTFIGSQYRVTQWSGAQLVNYTSKNLTGYRITVTFQTVN